VLARDWSKGDESIDAILEGDHRARMAAIEAVNVLLEANS
jgi:hypothetical protein